METLIFGGALLISIVYIIYIFRIRQFRSQKVYEFRNYLLNTYLNTYMSTERFQEIVGIIDRKWTFNDMYNSNKPLTLEEWFTKEEIELISKESRLSSQALEFWKNLTDTYLVPLAGTAKFDTVKDILWKWSISDYMNSDKELTLEAWYTEEEIKIIKNEI